MADIARTVEQLDETELDVLMKYIYRAMAMTVESSKMLKWHKEVEKVGGQGTIIRALADRYTV